ncbi:MAG: glycosyl transferase [Burkholderiales bacterium]|nr:glycosyl transferase [Burkholderiales bacterium]
MRREFHFVFGLRPQREPFHLLHWLALESCRRTQAPDTIVFHCRHRPWGPWWERIAPHLDVREVGAAPRGFDPSRYGATDEGRLIAGAGYDYAHEADFLRLEILFAAGGAYADIDTLFVERYPDAWFGYDCVLGEEPAIAGASGVLVPSLCNAVILARPGAPFLRRWTDEARASFDGTWNAHSCAAAARLWARHPDEVHVLPRQVFYRHAATRAGIASLFTELDAGLAGVKSLHLWAHLWWSATRVDFTTFHAEQVTPEWIARGASTVAAVARRFLPADVLADAIARNEAAAPPG